MSVRKNKTTGSKQGCLLTPRFGYEVLSKQNENREPYQKVCFKA